MGILKAIFGDYSTKEIKRIRPLCDKVLALEEEYKALDEATLRGKTAEFRRRLAEGAELDQLLPEAYAACREATRRVLHTPHFPVQILGGIILHQGRIAEMKTGEGKTQTVLLPAYLNALTGNGVHIVTVNEYLAARDSEWMGQVYTYLGLTVGLVLHDQTREERRAAYAADITYGTNNELGFDYLRDNMVVHAKDKVQRGHAFAIVDEVDSILIDEARTPLIISGAGDRSSELYELADRFAKTLKLIKVKEMDTKEDQDSLDIDADYIVDEKGHTATLTRSGVKKAERHFQVENLMDDRNVTLLHHINQAIKAHGVMRRDIEYVVEDGEVVIVDEHTGRKMPGRRYNEGLHQAIEAKEGVKVQRESRTLATITFQNYFRMYKKLSGMTGTAMTEELEFQQIYHLDVVEIPTNRPVVRVDGNDLFYKTEQGKFNAVIEQILECNARKQPVLVGTVSIEKSEKLSAMLKRRGIKHEVLNAKYHQKEAEIVAQAGKPGAVTVATNMAGRGTDIKLGGNPEFMAKNEMRRLGFAEELILEADNFGEAANDEVREARRVFKELEAKYAEEIRPDTETVIQAGGLFIIGTERHESRRIDNQLRGRSGRQGDPGETRFYLSAEDNLIRLFAGDRFYSIMNTFRIDDETALENKMLTDMVENAQRRVEERHFGARRDVIQFDDVMNRQREIIYGQRDQVLNGESVRDSIWKMVTEAIEAAVAQYTADDEEHENWNLHGLRSYFGGWLCDETDFRYTAQELEDLDRREIVDVLVDRAEAKYADKEARYGDETMREIERVILLRNVDRHWMNHIDEMEELKRGIHLRSYAQKDPVVMYRLEGFDMFDHMVAAIREDTARAMMTVEVRQNEEPKREQVAKETGTSAGDGTLEKKPVRNTASDKIGRNDPCPCGSGKKYKKCCGADKD
ncbi:MAG: preprotein translocase subunit SecA [Clostridia bacterium]|nr:preprotein translocase subunit SecA [Clostridia bacterium]